MLRWSIKENKKAIEWNVKRGESHVEDLEMSGFGVSDVVKYGVDGDGTLFHFHHPVFPTLRCRYRVGKGRH